MCGITCCLPPSAPLGERVGYIFNRGVCENVYTYYSKGGFREGFAVGYPSHISV